MIEPSVGSCDNAIAGTINGLFKAALIHRCGPWCSAGALQLATLDLIEWFDERPRPLQQEVSQLKNDFDHVVIVVIRRFGKSEP